MRQSSQQSNWQSIHHVRNEKGILENADRKRLRDEQDEKANNQSNKRAKKDPFFVSANDDHSDNQSSKQSNNQPKRDPFMVPIHDRPQSRPSRPSNKQSTKSDSSIDSFLAGDGSSDDQDDDDDQSTSINQSSNPAVKKRGKHAPLEISSKKPPHFLLNPLSKLISKKPQSIDPRFASDLPETSFSANFNKAAYSFIDDLKKEEIGEMRKSLKKVKNPEKLQEIKETLGSVQAREKINQKSEREQTVIKQWKKSEFASRAQGKKPFYLKKADVKKAQIIGEFVHATNSKGGIEAIKKKVERKNQQRAKKDIRFMPRQG